MPPPPRFHPHSGVIEWRTNMYAHPIFADRFAEYQRIRLSRSTHTALLGAYNTDVIKFGDGDKAAQFVIFTPKLVGAYVGTGLYSLAAVTDVYVNRLAVSFSGDCQNSAFRYHRVPCVKDKIHKNLLYLYRYSPGG